MGSSRHVGEPENRRIPSFAGIRTFMQLPHVEDRADALLREADLAVVGLPFDNGVTHRPGARFGPAAIRDVTGLLRSYNPAWQIAPMDHISGVDSGDSPVLPGNISTSLQWMQDKVAAIVEAGVVPLCLGGDHTVSLPVLRAVAAQHGPVALLHLDSHPDTWDGIQGEKFNHATPFRRAVDESLIDPESSLQLGIRGSVGGADDLEQAREMGFTVIPADRLLRMEDREVGEQVCRVLGDRPFHLSFDIDFLDPAFAPATGTPEVGGPSTAQCLSYLRSINYSNLKSFDLVEVSPAYDTGQITALAAANITYEVICGLAVSRAGH